MSIIITRNVEKGLVVLVMDKFEIKNKKAYFDFTIENTIEVGLVLEGREVKSVKNGKANLKGSWCDIENGEMWVNGMHISNFQDGKENAVTKYDPYRKRKLLLHKKEIMKLFQRKQLEGVTFVPLKLYFSNGKVKMLMGICKGKKQYDKREVMKKKDIQRDIQRKSDF